MPQGRRPGPTLPYRPMGGAVPCPGGWLVAAGKLQGITLAPTELLVVPRFIQVLEYLPAFDVLTVHAPVGLPKVPDPRGRRCDQEARRLLGWPRAGSVVSAPVRAALAASTPAEAARLNGTMSAVQWALLRRTAEVAEDMQLYRQRTVYEIHPELSFFQLNGDQPMAYAKHTEEGRAERRALLEKHLPGVERLLALRVRGATPEHALDAAAALWTARRIASRAVVRIPEEPEWDEVGLRMEILR
jgi:predicted RNase H-like nuclease